jgi:hypothetical protein
MSARADALQRIDAALTELAAVQASLTAARGGEGVAIDRNDLARRFHSIAHASTGHHSLVFVHELAALAGKVAPAGECEVVQQAADVLSLLLRDLGHQLLGCRGAEVMPAATALRERLEHELLTPHR